MAKRTGWVNVRAPAGLIDDVDKFIKESKGDFTSRADFVKAAIREKLERKENVLLARDLVESIAKNPELKKLIKKSK